MEMIKSRTIGIEMEGYVSEHPENGFITAMNGLDCEVGNDESLVNPYWNGEDEDDGYWDDDDDRCERSGSYDKYGVEVRTKPINDLSALVGIVDALHNHGWSTDIKAGTHIHVDISDYTEIDKAKLLRFGKGIERIIFMYTEDYRNGNGYCKVLPSGWRKIFWKNSAVAKSFNLEDGLTDLSSYVYEHDSRDVRNMVNYKFNWMNIFSSNYSTVEFRLFNAMRSSEEVISQANLAYSIVELVKHSSPEQLEFIIKEIYSATTVEGIADNFCQVLSIDDKMNIIGSKAYDYLKNKIEAAAAATQSEPQAI